MVLWDDATRREVADLPTYLVTLPTLVSVTDPSLTVSTQLFRMALKSIGDVKAYRKCTHYPACMCYDISEKPLLKTTFLCHHFRPTTAAGQVQVAKNESEMHVSS